jgi:hypothetical protein
VIAIAAGGAGVLNTVEHTGDALPDEVRWLLVGSLAVAVVSVAAIARTLEIRRRYVRVYRPAEVALLLSGVLSLLVGFTDWGSTPSLTAMVILLAPVATGLFVWLKHNEPEQVGFG